MQLKQHLRWCIHINSKIYLLPILIMFAFSVEGQVLINELSGDAGNKGAELINTITATNSSADYTSSPINKPTLIVNNPPIAPTPSNTSAYSITAQSSVKGKKVTVDLDNQIIGESGGGIWSQVGTTPSIILPDASNLVNFKGAPVGTYTYRFTQSISGYSDVTTDVKIVVSAYAGGPCPSAPCNGVWDGNN